MKISILITDEKHPVYNFVATWMQQYVTTHEIQLCTDKTELRGGELLFLISCSDIIKKDIRRLYKKTLVIHASDLPQGRGWSPMNWEIIGGNNNITVTLLEAEDAVDSGDIWRKLQIQFAGHELCDELNEKLFYAELALMDFAIANFDDINPVPQDNNKATFYPKRTSQDSRIDPNLTIKEQFNLLRVADPARYPAFFELHGHTYKITLEKM